MKRIRKIVFGLLLTTSLTATAAYSQTPTPKPSPTPTSNSQEPAKPKLKPSPAIQSSPDPTPNSSTSPLSNPNLLIINGNEIKDAQGNVISLKPASRGVLDGLETPNLDKELWQALGLTVLAGIFGGLIAELLSLQGNIERPHAPSQDEWAAKFAHASHENVIDLGILSRLIIGGLAAPPAMLIFRPESAFALLAMSVVAGSAGTAIFRSLQDRLKTVIAEAEKNEAQAHLRTQSLKLNSQSINALIQEAINEFKKLEGKVITASVIMPEEPTKLQFPANMTLTLSREEFEAVWKPLNEIKGIDPQIINQASSAFAELQQAVCNVAESQTREKAIALKANSTLDIELFNQVRKYLNEAKGKMEVIDTSPAATPMLASPVDNHPKGIPSKYQSVLSPQHPQEARSLNS